MKHRNHRTAQSWADRIADLRYKGWVEKALADMKAHPEDAHRARKLARLLWGDGGAVLVERDKPAGQRCSVGKRASAVARGLDSRGKPQARLVDIAYGVVGRGRDFAAAFADARIKGQLTRVLLTAQAEARRPAELEERPRCWDPAAHGGTWVLLRGVSGSGPEPLCGACLDGGRVPGVF